jgi:predicted GNAT family acetyltransferase
MRESEREVLSFLAVRPIHTVIMAGLIRDNGLVSPLNRGTFYSCRDAAGRLEGVALIGHLTMVETKSEEVIELFAELAQQHHATHVILGEQETVEQFLRFYAPTHGQMRLAARELLLEQSWPIEVLEAVNLRLATLEDAEEVVRVHAQLAFQENGVNPMTKDPIGFRQRTERRIKQGRVWVWMEEGLLIFKADISNDTPEAVYLEGIYVNPEQRGKGYGTRCISQLSRNLLSSTGVVCLLVNEDNKEAIECYRKAGFRLHGRYDTVYLQ